MTITSPNVSADFTSVKTILKPLLRDMTHPALRAAWDAVAATLPRPVPKDARRAVSRAVRVALTAARSACGGRLPNGSRRPLQEHVAALAQHALAVRLRRASAVAEVLVPVSERYPRLSREEKEVIDGQYRFGVVMHGWQ